MCGIFGCAPVVQNWLERAVHLHHSRGPDQSAVFATDWDGADNIGIAVNRLEITGDGPGSAQPIRSQSGRTICIFNGALYNFNDIYEEFGISKVSDNDAADC